LAAVEAGESPEAAARRCAVGRSTAYRWVAAARDEGRRTAKPMGGGPAPVIRGGAEAALRRMLEGKNHLTLAECRDRLAEEMGVRVHPWTVGRALRRMGWTWKKRSLRAAEQDREDVAAARAAWRTDDAAGVGGIPPERLVFLDECGVLTNMARLWGRSPRGTRAYGTVPCGHWTRLTVLGAIGIGGVVAAMGVEAATSGGVFHTYLARVLLPDLRRTRPDAVLVLDNLGAHKTPEVRDLLDRSGFAYRYLPLPAILLAGLEPHRARLGEAQVRTAPRRRARHRGAAPGARPRAQRHHRRRRRRLLPPCRLWPSQLIRGLL
jgi:transposase